ncbi:MAG: hypothetical protein AAB421_03170 [Patescibacteria group bacterium]
MPTDIIKVLVPAITAFSVGIGITPLVTHYLYRFRVWKIRGGKQTLDGAEATEFNRLHGSLETHTPRMGGIIIWASVLITIVSIGIIAKLVPSAATIKLDFLSRDQTWIPLVTLVIGAGVGFVSDLLDVRWSGQGMRLRTRLPIILVLATVLGWWFWAKLEVISVGIPFGDPVYIGWLIIPLFVAISLSLYASGVIDGIDGLSGGVFASIFASYAIIAFVQAQINLAAFCAAIVGGILAFLWYNIPPARFYMTETGTMALTLTIAVIAFTTDQLGDGVGIAVLPVIGFLLVATVSSNILQIFWKKVYGRKLLRIAPLHHHFEALGWPSHKVTMRYWVLSVMFAFAGVIIAFSGS